MEANDVMGDELRSLLRVATQSDEAFGDFRETDGNAVVAADLDVWVVLLECLIEVPEDLETIPFEAKRGRSG